MSRRDNSFKMKNELRQSRMKYASHMNERQGKIPRRRELRHSRMIAYFFNSCFFI